MSVPIHTAVVLWIGLIHAGRGRRLHTPSRLQSSVFVEQRDLDTKGALHPLKSLVALLLAYKIATAFTSSSPRLKVTRLRPGRHLRSLPEVSLHPTIAGLSFCAGAPKQFRHRCKSLNTRNCVRGSGSRMIEIDELQLTAEGSVTRQVPMGDRAILQNLYERHGWRNIDMGSGGNCLFLSVAPQITASDVASLTSRSEAWSHSLADADIANRWETLSNRERAGLLRRIAILDEIDFINDLRKSLSDRAEIASEDRWRALELFTDMAEEFISTGKTELASGISRSNLKSIHGHVREIVRDTPIEKMYGFVLTHAEEYMQVTGREGNWAGSSEMAALAHALKRPFLAYGNNWVSQDTTAVSVQRDGTQEVLPYFSTPATFDTDYSASPVRVFQANGGGHYQMLACKDVKNERWFKRLLKW